MNRYLQRHIDELMDAAERHEISVDELSTALLRQAFEIQRDALGGRAAWRWLHEVAAGALARGQGGSKSDRALPADRAGGHTLTVAE